MNLDLYNLIQGLQSALPTIYHDSSSSRLPLQEKIVFAAYPENTAKFVLGNVCPGSLTQVPFPPKTT
jgi:hypothetical protein